MNGIYSEDLLTATAATFFDVARVESFAARRARFTAETPWVVQSTFFTNEPTDEFEAIAKTIVVTTARKRHTSPFLAPSSKTSWPYATPAPTVIVTALSMRLAASAATLMAWER